MLFKPSRQALRGQVVVETPMTYKVTADKEGRLRAVYPKVVVGYERLNRKGPSRLSTRSIVCDEHGNKPASYVFCRGVAIKCCRYCITENCQLTKAIRRPNWSEEPGSDGPDGFEGGQMDNPVGHSL